MGNQLKNFYGVTELSAIEKITINGGNQEKPSTTTGFWFDAAYFIGAVAKGIAVFSTEGGRNAGLIVR